MQCFKNNCAIDTGLTPLTELHCNYVIYIMKVALIGKICSGKSYISSYLNEVHDFNVYSFGQPVKKFAKEIFNLKTKDRAIIQDFAQKMKELDSDVWIKYILNQMNTDKNENIVVDDVRFPNEYKALQNENFIFIRLLISSEFQKNRIISTYGKEQGNQHIMRINDISESYTDKLQAEYTINITKQNEKSIYKTIDALLKTI